MAKDSTFYYTGTVKGSKYVQGMFFFAFTPSGDVKDYYSNYCKSPVWFKQLSYMADGARIVSVAMLQSHATEMFPVKKSHDQLIIYGYKKSAGGYQFGPAVTTIFNTVTVTNVKPIRQWEGLPGVYGPQLEEIGKQKLRLPAVAAVTFFVEEGADVVVSAGMDY